MEEKKKESQIMWHDVYKVFAEQLRDFARRTEDPQTELYKLAFESGLIKNMKWFTNFTKFKCEGVDPVHIFASFNRHRQREKNREDLINEWLRLIGVGLRYSNISFEGCPSPFTVRILSARKKPEQQGIWNIFKDVISNKNYELRPDLDDTIRSWYGLKLPSFTIFLFWIAPDRYISLDKNTTSLLIKRDPSRPIPKDISGYKNLLNEIKPNEYINLVKEAYLGASDEEKHEETEPTESAIDRWRAKQKFVPRRSYVRIIGVKISPDCPEKYRKNLEPGYYNFFEDVSIAANEILFHPEKHLTDIYSDPNQNFSIHVHAMAGKNGSGKSALVELILLALNNIYISCEGVTSSKFFPSDDLKLELYYEANGYYKIKIDGSKIMRKGFVPGKTKNQFDLNPSDLTLEKEFLSIFFYTIVLNYSLHGLNSSHNRAWLEPIFRKNDGYENPIVIEPYREEGNIDINDQNDLLRSRFLSNLLDLLEIETGTEKEFIPIPKQLIDKEGNARCKYVSAVVTDRHEVEEVVLTLLPDKAETIIAKDDTHLKNFHELTSLKDLTNYNIDLIHILECIERHFDFGDSVLKKIDFDNTEQPKSIALRYLVRKIFRIAKTYYPYYHNYSRLREKQIMDKYIYDLSRDFSHITYKVHQTINFLKGRTAYTSSTISIEALATTIEASKMEYGAEEETGMETIHLIPPPFFAVDIYVSDLFNKDAKPIQFEELSSGQRQHLFSIHTILYHLKNINSIRSKDRTSYPYANIILDEVELYAHPDMQRKYLYDLLNLIKITEWESMLGISVCFITHSPFILSDITKDRILFLMTKEQKEEQKQPIDSTFGANIHELLSNAFFLSNTIGEFALRKIEEILLFYEKFQNEIIKNKAQLQNEYKDHREEFWYVAERIGEKYIQGIIKNHLNKMDESLLNDSEKKRKRIEALQNEINELKKDLND